MAAGPGGVTGRSRRSAARDAAAGRRLPAARRNGGGGRGRPRGRDGRAPDQRARAAPEARRRQPLRLRQPAARPTPAVRACTRRAACRWTSCSGSSTRSTRSTRPTRRWSAAPSGAPFCAHERRVRDLPQPARPGRVRHRRRHRSRRRVRRAAGRPGGARGVRGRPGRRGAGARRGGGRARAPGAPLPALRRARRGRAASGDQRDRGPARPRHRPGQQRRRRPAAPRGDARGVRVGRPPERQPAPPLLRHPGGRADDAGSRPRLGDQPRVDQRAHRPHGSAGLHRRQSGDRGADAHAGPGARPARHPGQLRHPGLGS